MAHLASWGRSCYVPSSTILNCFVSYKWYQYDIKCNASYIWIRNCFIRAFYCKYKIWKPCTWAQPWREAKNLWTAMSSVNDVARRVVYNQIMNVGCCSHTIDLVDERINRLVLSEFTKAWIELFSCSPKSHLS